MKEITSLQSIGQVDGISEASSYAMRIAPNGQLWFIGGIKSTQIYRFDGVNAYKWELNENYGAQVRTAVTFSDNAVFFNVSQYSSQNPTVIKINENSAEKWICEDLTNQAIERMIYTQMGLVCVFGDGMRIKSNDIRIWESEKFIPLLDLSEYMKNVTLLDLTSDGHLLILGEKKGIVYDLVNKKIVNIFSTHGAYMKFITCGEYNISYCDTRIEIRDSIGHITHNIDIFGKSENSISKSIECIDSKDYVNIENIAYIDSEHILIHFSDRQSGKRHYLRSVHIPTMSLNHHSLDGCIKSRQVISECHFDKSGALWLNQYINKNDYSKLIVVRQGSKKPDVVNKPRYLFKTKLKATLFTIE